MAPHGRRTRAPVRRAGADEAAAAPPGKAPSYAEQAEHLRGRRPDKTRPLQKPDRAAQAAAPGARQLAGTRKHPVYAAPLQRPLMRAELTAEQQKQQSFVLFWRWFGFLTVTTVALLGAWPTFTWRYLAVACAITVAQSCLGIAMCFHRMLTHGAFKVPRPLEYALAYIGTLALQGSPTEWVSNHRYHHLHCDTPLDPHSPYEGLLHAHFAWLIKPDTEAPFLARDNVPDLSCQAFYRHLDAHWVTHGFARMVITACFGLGPLVWTWAVPIFFSWHAAWTVNSVCHVWGDRPYITGDLSTDCWVANLIAFGDGYHCTHHAFPTSARHGLEPWQWDPVWYIIWTLQKVGLAWDVRLPTQRDLARKRRPRAAGQASP